jgi:hypothetical protein
VNVAAIQQHPLRRYEIWEIGGALGGRSQRALIRSFASKGIDGLIFVLDGSDRRRVGEACEALHQLLHREEEGSSGEGSKGSGEGSKGSGEAGQPARSLMHTPLMHTPLLVVVSKQDVQGCLEPQEAAPWLAIGREKAAREIRVVGSMTGSGGDCGGGGAGGAGGKGGIVGGGTASGTASGTAGEGVDWILGVIADTCRAQRACQ